MKLLRALVWALGLVALVLGGAAAYLPTFLTRHKDLLEATASRVLGQPVRIDGEFGLAWRPEPSLALESVRIGDGDLGQGGAQARVDQVNAGVDLGALLDGQIRLARLAVRGRT